MLHPENAHYPHHHYGGVPLAEIHRRDRVIAKEKVTPFPPYSGIIVKILTLLVFLALLAALALYIHYTIHAYNEDREYPKSSMKTLNKEKAPLEFPAVTVCAYGLPENETFNVFSCNVSNFRVDLTESTPTKNCSETRLARKDWEYEGISYPFNCHIFNSKSALHTESYKADNASFLNFMEIIFESSDAANRIGVLITAWDQVPNITNITNPTTWTSDGLFTIISLERYERKFIDQPGFTEWDIYPSQLTFASDTNFTRIRLFFKQLLVEETKEEHTYNVVQVIANISAAAGELLGFSFFELYVILLAAIYLLYDRSHL